MGVELSSLLKTVLHEVEDRDAFVAALAKVQVKGPMGMVSFDDRHGIVSDFYVLKVEKGANGQLQNHCGEKISQVKDPYAAFP